MANLLPTYTSSRHRETWAFIWSRVYGHLAKSNIHSLRALILVSTKMLAGQLNKLRKTGETTQVIILYRFISASDPLHIVIWYIVKKKKIKSQYVDCLKIVVFGASSGSIKKTFRFTSIHTNCTTLSYQCTQMLHFLTKATITSENLKVAKMQKTCSDNHKVYLPVFLCVPETDTASLL